MSIFRLKPFRTHPIVRALSSPVWMQVLLPVIMLYLIAGTWAQKEMGLYRATQMFFQDWIFRAGPVPLPGMPVFICILAVNLAAKLVFSSPWRKDRAGIIVAHMGALLLMVGGFLTAVTAREGFIELKPGEMENSVSDYHDRELAVLTAGSGQTLRTWPHDELHKGRILSVPAGGTAGAPEVPFRIEILRTCRNCAIRPRKTGPESGDGWRHAANQLELFPAPLEIEDEINRAGAVIEVQGAGAVHNGRYILFEDMPGFPVIADVKIALRRAQRPLPFAVELIEFRRETHPGTPVARHYESMIRVHDGPASWESRVSMNAPLRYRGYTLYQSSYVQTGRGQKPEISVLAVVWNAGRIFPYLAGSLMCLGMALHFVTGRRLQSGETA